MGLRQTFRFRHESPDHLRDLLLGLAKVAEVEDRGEFLVFSERPGEAAFTFDCELTAEGFTSERAGDYFLFLGIVVEALTGRFGKVEIEDL